MGNATTGVETPKASVFGADNLQIEQTPECVTIRFDPRVIIGNFSGGRNRIASTGAFEKLRDTGVRVMLHVGTIVG